MSLRILDRMRRQYAVYWAPTGTVNDDGEPVFVKPVELKVRWETRVSLTRFGGQFKDMGFRDVVYLPPSRNPNTITVQVGGYLWKGRLRDLPAAKKTSPYNPKGGTDDPSAKEITAYTEIPSLRATRFLRVAIL